MEEMEKREDAINALEETVIQFDWSRDSSLTPEQISLILEGKSNEIDVFDENAEYICDLEMGARMSIAEDFEIDVGLLSEVYPMIDYNINSLVRNTHGYIGLQLDIEHDPYYRDYMDVECELEDLGINPHDVDDEWPNIDGRNPLLTTEDLKTLWLNMGYYGNYFVLLDCTTTLELYMAGKTPNLLKKGANITIYDFINGSGSDIVEIIRDMKVVPEDIMDDGKRPYGVQRCYGLVDDAWNGILEGTEKANDDVPEEIKIKV